MGRDTGPPASDLKASRWLLGSLKMLTRNQEESISVPRWGHPSQRGRANSPDQSLPHVIITIKDTQDNNNLLVV